MIVWTEQKKGSGSKSTLHLGHVDGVKRFTVVVPRGNALSQNVELRKHSDGVSEVIDIFFSARGAKEFAETLA